MAVNEDQGPTARRDAGAPAQRGAVQRALAAREARLDELRVRRAAEYEALLRAGRRVFVRRGYAQARVEDVLAEAGISTRAFYRFHASKDELFLALFDRAHAAALARLRAAVSRHAAPAAQLDAYVDEALDVASNPRRRAETLLFTSVPFELAERHAAEVLGCREQLVAVLREILAAGRASGAFRAVEPADDAWAIHGALGAAISRLLEGGADLDREALARRLKRFCRAALGARSGASGRAGSDRMRI